jgi:hypothetical protein
MVAKYFLFFAVITYTDGPKGNTHWAAVRAEQVNILFFFFPAKSRRTRPPSRKEPEAQMSQQQLGRPSTTRRNVYVSSCLILPWHQTHHSSDGPR